MADSEKPIRAIYKIKYEEKLLDIRRPDFPKFSKRMLNLLEKGCLHCIVCFFRSSVGGKPELPPSPRNRKNRCRKVALSSRGYTFREEAEIPKIVYKD